MPQITSQKTINVKIGFIGICPACAQDSLKREGYLRTVEHKGSSGKIKQFKNVCGNCHIELFDEDCSRENRRSWVVFQKQVEGVPTGAEIKAMRIAVGLTSEDAGNLLGGGPKAFSKYENEEIVPQGAMRTLLLTLIKFPSVINEIKQAKGVSVGKSLIRKRSKQLEVMPYPYWQLPQLEFVRPAIQGAGQEFVFTQERLNATFLRHPAVAAKTESKTLAEKSMIFYGANSGPTSPVTKRTLRKNMSRGAEFYSSRR